MLLSVVTSNAMAEWVQEPSSFMGIALGQPISVSITKVCPKYPEKEMRMRDDRVDAVNTMRSGITCYDDSRRESENSIRTGTVGSYAIWNLRVPPIKHLAYIKTLDDTLHGAVGQVLASFDSSDFSQVKTMFTIKYGSPHKEEVKKVQTVGGAQFDNTVLTWSGEKVVIKIESLGSRNRYGEYGAITVATTEYLIKKSKESEDAAKKGAEGL